MYGGFMEERQTCGKGLAKNSELPAAFADVLAAMAENLKTHLKALHPHDEVSKPEYEAYKNLVDQYRDVVTQLRSTADEMSRYRDLPMANHDLAVMGSPLTLQAFEKFVTEEKELLTLLQTRVNQDASMLADFQKAGSNIG
jgi:hypothetical protein